LPAPAGGPGAGRGRRAGAGRAALARREPDDGGGAALAAGADAGLLDPEGLREAPGEGRVVLGGPHAEHPAAAQGLGGAREAGAVVEGVVAGAGEALGAVVDVEEDGVEGAGRAAHHLADVVDDDLDARVVEGAAGEVGEGAPIPGD